MLTVNEQLMMSCSTNKIPNPMSIYYPDQTVKRAEVAMRCSPFLMKLFTTMRDESVSLMAIANAQGLNLGYTQSPLTELAAENALLWLIQVGILRREVDGQGITDRFRLTPLGRQLLDYWEQQEDTWRSPTWSDRISNFIGRWFGIRG